LFQGRQGKRLAWHLAPGFPRSTAVTVGLAVSRLEAEAPAALGLLRLLAFLAPEPVPLALLLTARKGAGMPGRKAAATIKPLLGDQVATEGAIAALRRYSLISPAGDGMVLVHRQVQATIRSHLGAQAAAQWERAVAALGPGGDPR
jgi:hypothetical protein